MASGSRIQGIIVEIGGDTSKLQSALKDVDKGISHTKQQLKDVENLLKLDPKNITLLQQKFNLLGQQITQTENKLKQLKEIQQQADDKGVDKNSESYQQLQREIIATENALKNLQEQQANTNLQMADLGGSTEQLTNEQKKLLIQTQKQQTGLKKLGKSAVTAGKDFKSLKADLLTATAAATAVITAIVAATKALVNISSEAADSAKQIEKLTAQTEMTTDQLQEIKYVSDLLNVSFEDITKTVKQNIKSMSEANNLNWDYMEAYQLLGIEIKDSNGALRDSSEVYWEVIEALRNVTNETDRDIIAEQLLGRKATDLNAILDLQATEFEKLKQEAHDVGAVLDTDTISALSNLDDAFTKLENQWKGITNTVIAALAPTMAEITNAISDMLTDMSDEFSLSKFINNLLSYTPEIATLIGDLIADILQNLPSILAATLSAAGGIIDILLKVLGDLDWGKLINELLMMIITQLPDLLVKVATSLLSNAVSIVGSLITSLFEFLDVTKFEKRTEEMGANLAVSFANGLRKNIESAINTIIDGINKVAGIFGGKLDHISIPQIPMLAKGGILSSGSAIVGEAGAELLTISGGKAMVQPLTNNTTNNYNYGGGCGEITINFTGNLAQLARILQPEIERENQRIGTNLLQ